MVRCAVATMLLTRMVRTLPWTFCVQVCVICFSSALVTESPSTVTRYSASEAVSSSAGAEVETAPDGSEGCSGLEG